MEPHVRYAKTSDGVNIAWYMVGSGPPFVWPSAPPGSAVGSWRIPEFRRIIETIAQRGTLVTYDPRGFGMSDRDQADFSCAAYVRDLEAVMDAAKVERCVMQGFSFMAIPTLIYAARHPGHLMALVLNDGVMRGTDMSSSWTRLVRMAEEDWGDAQTWLARMNQAGFASTTTLELTRDMINAAATQEAFVGFAKALESWDASEELSQVTTPALVTHYGAQSTFLPLESCRRLATALPNGMFVPVEPQQGEEILDAARGAILNFLREVLPRRPRREPPPSASGGTAIILFADIVDSTALTERLGDTAFRAKARDLDAVLRAVISEHSGTCIDAKTLGDGVLATFASAAKAIEAALACGRAGNDAGLPLHLGLHAGDVIREENNVYGGAVNIASRISGLSAPGEVLVSDTLRGLARTSAGVTFEDRGEQALKGVGEPVRVYGVRRMDHV